MNLWPCPQLEYEGSLLNPGDWIGEEDEDYSASSARDSHVRVSELGLVRRRP
jgi:hypothetical protein